MQQPVISNMNPAQTPAHVAFEVSVPVITSRDQSKSTFTALRKPVMGTFWGGRSFWKGRKTFCATAEQPILHPEVELPQNKAGTQRYHAWQELLVSQFEHRSRLAKPPFFSSQAPSPAAACVVKSWGRTFPVHLAKEPKKARQ